MTLCREGKPYDGIDNAVTVIIPTTCEAKRGASLKRAMASVQSQCGVFVELIVIVNGTRFDSALYEDLRGIPTLKLAYLSEGGLPLAVRYAREQVKTPFFAFLDDDDEYLPGALKYRLKPLLEDRSLDFVVTNGYRVNAEGKELVIDDPQGVSADPMASLLKSNWLSSCGGLFRAATITKDYFDGETNYFEWTFLAYKLSISKKMILVNVPTFNIHDTPASLSKSQQYREAEITVLEKIYALELPREIKRGIRIKLGRAHHNLSNYYRLQGEVKAAWRHHLASLGYPEGTKYLAYSRRLVFPWPSNT